MAKTTAFVDAMIDAMDARRAERAKTAGYEPDAYGAYKVLLTKPADAKATADDKVLTELQALVTVK